MEQCLLSCYDGQRGKFLDPDLPSNYPNECGADPRGVEFFRAYNINHAFNVTQPYASLTPTQVLFGVRTPKIRKLVFNIQLAPHLVAASLTFHTLYY
jgi:hypothetical protein